MNLFAGHKKGLLRVISTLLIVAELVFVGGGISGMAIAQTTTDSIEPTPPAVTEEVIIPVDTASTTPETTDLQGASSTPQLQETFTDQETLPTDVTEEASNTVDIAIATSTDGVSTDPTAPSEEVIPDENSTTTEGEVPPADETLPTEETPPPPESEVTPPGEVPQPEPPPQVESEQIEPPPNQTLISAEELKPEPKYVFQISGKKFNTARRAMRPSTFRAKTVMTEVAEVVSAEPTVTPDNTTGVVNVAGACEDKYYVILVYKNPEDYARDPRTYVVNRSFPCEGGAFSYDVTNLPPTLPDGNYYLLVGSMGEVGPWSPITGITEITLHRNH